MRQCSSQVASPISLHPLHHQLVTGFHLLFSPKAGLTLSGSEGESSSRGPDSHSLFTTMGSA